MLAFIVSDDPRMASQLREALASNDYRCPDGNLASGEHALEALACLSEPPDIILFVLHRDRELSDRLIQELRSKSRSYLVVVGPRDLQTILRSIRAGGDDYLDEAGDLGRELHEILQRGRAAVQLRGSSARVTAVIASGGGNGCTTIAANLAVLLAQKRERSVLLDLDFRGGCAASLLNLRPRHTFGDVIRNIENLDCKMFEQCLVKHESGAEVLASGDELEDADFLTEEAMTRVCRVASLHSPHIVVDLKEFWRKSYAKLLQSTTKIVVVTRLDLPAIANANRALEYLERTGVDRTRVSLVVNRAGQPNELPATDVSCALRMKISHTIPHDSKTMNSCTNCGSPAVCEAPQSKCARAIAGIADEIDDHVSSVSATSSRIPLLERAAPFIGKLVQATNVRLESFVARPTM